MLNKNFILLFKTEIEEELMNSGKTFYLSDDIDTEIIQLIFGLNVKENICISFQSENLNIV